MKQEENMKTLEDLLYYCNEPEPVGAILLTGEWGCGKTYLIEHDLKEALSEKSIIVRVSLFGISSSEDIHKAVKSAWLEQYCKIKGIDAITDTIGKGKQLISKLEFLPEWIRGIASTDVAALFPMNTEIEGKQVILVFDDLERCQVSFVDVLGVINDYCENQKYHTIIVANQEKILNYTKELETTAEILFSVPCNNSNTTTEKKATLTIHSPNTKEEIPYTEIKEKIIQRTIKYIPDYASIVHAVIQSFKYQNDEYKEFIIECEEGLLELFAPNRDMVLDEKEQKRPHNIRSLKCAISDFFRIYKILIDNGFVDIDKWLYSFVSYVIAYKADIAKEGSYGTLFTDNEVRDLYPAFQNQYIFNASKNWVLHGIWDETAILHEIENIKQREEAKNPSEIIRTNRIVDVDEDIIASGFDSFLNEAYIGSLSLDDYVLFIENCAWARYYEYSFPSPIDWEKINEGVKIRINHIITEMPDGQLLYHVISSDNRERFLDNEWETYEQIYNFALGNGYIFTRNQKLYAQKMQELGSNAYIIVQSKRFNMFSEEMAIVTAEAYKKDTNSDKRNHINYFKKMWTLNVQSTDFDFDASISGFSKLKELLGILYDKYTSENKTFAALHTNQFIKILDELLERKE